jgi:hypothetical protein
MNIKIKNRYLVNKFIKVIKNVGGDDDGVVGLNEFMMGMYGKKWDGKDNSVDKLKNEVWKEYRVMIGVNKDNEDVYLKVSGDEIFD